MKMQSDRWFNLNNPYGYRDDNLRVLGFKSYSEYLRSALWKSIRKRVIDTGPPECAKCLKRKATQVHHRSYDPATLRGDSILSLTKLCGGCHRRAERPKDTTQGRYDRYKSAGEFMLQRRHPTERKMHLRRKKALAG